VKKIAKEYDSNSVPDLTSLRKELSKASKLRHKFWNKLRAVRNQVGRYLEFHKIPTDQLNQIIKDLPENEKIFIETEWEAGRGISIKDLNQLFDKCNLMWVTSQTTEEGRRENIKKGYRDHWMGFFSSSCKNCGLPLSGRQQKYCSQNCDDQYRKRKYERKMKRGKKTSVESHNKMDNKDLQPPDGPNPQKGFGKKNELCENYSNCLNCALDWMSFNCEKCKLIEDR
jgi:hypothetical protein